MTYYKWLNSDRTTTYQGYKWPVRAKAWTPKISRLVICQSGWHLATHEGIIRHLRVDAVLWEAEGRGKSKDASDKVAFESARLIHPIGTLDRRLATLWGADCAERVLHIYEDKFPDDDRPRKAIEVAKVWAHDPSDENRQKVLEAKDGRARGADAAYTYAAAAANASIYVAASAYAAADAAAAAYIAADANASERIWQTNHLLNLLENNPL